jgi:uncharacterized protein (TIGR03086 family)
VTHGMPDPVTLFRRATAQAAEVMAKVTSDQLADPTPCAEWCVQELIDHLVASTDYLRAALDGRDQVARSGATVADYRMGVAACLAGLAAPGALERTCRSPLGFEWPLDQATAGTFMDTLVHTWDLATATGQDPCLDPGLVEACVAMFLPGMPERGRQAGIVGPAVLVGPDASPQDRLLAAMGRHP